MHFWVYHKSAKQFLGPFNENTIVDFCISNKESSSSFYISVNGKQNQMEWSAFALKYSYLFENKATERELREKSDENYDEEDFKEPRSPFFKIVIILLPLLIFIGIVVFVLTDLKKPDKRKNQSENSITEIKKTEPAPKKEKKIFPAKRKAVKTDNLFKEIKISKKELYKAWKGKNIKNKDLSPQKIKTVMDAFIPNLTECYNQRISAGDKNLNGTINMKIKVLGTGTVAGVVFTDDKYKSTLFSDCIANSLQKKTFPLFKAEEQIFTYYYNFK